MRSTSLDARTADHAWAPDERSPSTARRAVRATLTGWGVDEESIGDAELLTSEIVTNAVLHPRETLVRDTLITASMWLAGTLLRVEVTDADPRLPRRCHPTGADEGFRGIALVEAFSLEWGAEALPDGRGKTVWWSQQVALRT